MWLKAVVDKGCIRVDLVLTTWMMEKWVVELSTYQPHIIIIINTYFKYIYKLYNYI